MKTNVKVSMSKVHTEEYRFLNYVWEFKNEKIADIIIEKMEQKFIENGYDWKFSTFPERRENGEYVETIDIPYQLGMMNEYKKDMTKMWNEVKKEI